MHLTSVFSLLRRKAGQLQTGYDVSSAIRIMHLIHINTSLQSREAFKLSTFNNCMATLLMCHFLMILRVSVIGKCKTSYFHF